MNSRPNKGHIPLVSPFLCASVVLYPRNALIRLGRSSDTSHNSSYPSITSAELLCTLTSPPFAPSGISLDYSPSPQVPSPNVSTKLVLQRRANLRARRQQRYSRDESALATALRGPAEYERLFPSRPSTQYAVKQLELRIRDANARLAELRVLLRDDATDRVTHQALLRTRWLLERWVSSVEKEALRASESTGHPVPPDPVIPSTRPTRQDTNLAYFFTHSPTRTATPRSQHKRSSPIEPPRRIARHNVEPPQLRSWPLTTTLRVPMKLKAFPPGTYGANSQRSIVTPTPNDPLSSPELSSSDEDSMPPFSEPSSPIQATSTMPSFPPIPDTPLDDSRTRTWTGFAVIYAPLQPSDEELLAAFSADMATVPMPEYVSYLLDQLEPIGEGVFLPGISRRPTTTSLGFEMVSRPSIEVYEYPVLPRSRLLVRRSVGILPPVRPRLGILSGPRAAREDSSIPESPGISSAQGRVSPRSGVFSKMRRSMTVRACQ